ncbi:DUF4136 domain-containing protein [Brevundimonas sp.]|jgi:hypothetical protein|uniref:DUF4136 domain-containing protein n=1 Tax=Brevundimonas sp. TaxID=1871086 RepID=UPI001814E426|nr:DUF4136 domain-containing protein [Brevundimonas sp.]MBA4808033.1 DUF4136 domain-containing protein [Brevundimonas sp.]
MNRRTFGLTMLTMALGACATGPSISSDTTPGAEFAHYRTYDWVNLPPPPGMNPVALARIRQGIEREMAAKGYSRARPGDITLIVTVAGKEQLDISQRGPFAHDLSVRNYTDGTLAVDAFDTRTRQPIWHGQAVQRVDPRKLDPELIEAAITGVMARLPSRDQAADGPFTGT